VADWTSSVRSYLRQTLVTVTNLPAVAYEGRAFTPTIGVPWVREQLLPMQAPVETLGAQGLVREDFSYRLTVYSPTPGGKLSDHEDMVDAIRAKFFPGQVIRDLGSTIFGIVTEARRSQSIIEPDWIGTAISIYAYFHRATRAA
jgi:hypothetical protein